MFDTLLLRLSLHCNTSLHFTTLHPSTLHYTYRHFTSSHLYFTTLSFSLTHLNFLSFYFTSHHYTRHSTVLISKLISKMTNPFTALKNLSPFHFTFFIFFNLSYQPFTLLCYSYLQLTSLHFTSLHSFLRLHAPLALQPESFQHVAHASSLSPGWTQFTTGPTLFLTTRL
jgi:hypothetical protein